MSTTKETVPTIFIYGPAKTGKTTLAQGFQKRIPGLQIASTSEILTQQLQERDRNAGISEPPVTYPRDVLFNYGVSLQHDEPAILARLIAEKYQAQYDEGLIKGLLYVGSRRFAEAQYVHDHLSALFIAVHAPIDVSICREYDEVRQREEIKIQELRKQFLQQYQAELPELNRMLVFKDIMLDGTAGVDVMIHTGMQFVTAKGIFR